MQCHVKINQNLGQDFDHGCKSCAQHPIARGPTLCDISYALAEINFEITKSEACWNQKSLLRFFCKLMQTLLP